MPLAIVGTNDQRYCCAHVFLAASSCVHTSLESCAGLSLVVHAPLALNVIASLSLVVHAPLALNVSDHTESSWLQFCDIAILSSRCHQRRIRASGRHADTQRRALLRAAITRRSATRLVLTPLGRSANDVQGLVFAAASYVQERARTPGAQSQASRCMRMCFYKRRASNTSTLIGRCAHT